MPDHRSRAFRHTGEEANMRIRVKTEAAIARSMSGAREDIDRRLAQLEREWDIERTLEANAAVLSLTGLGLSIAVSKKWLLLSAVAAAFLLQQAFQGWCPPVPFLRRLGIRTAAEINAERSALKLLRGDFTHAPGRFKNASLLLEASASG